jgi:dual oxidase
MIITVCFVFAERQYSYTEKQRYDGWFNNLAHPDWGSVGE